MARLALALAVALSCAALVPGCTADASAPSDIGQVRQAILGGTESDPSQDDVVMLVLIDPVKNLRLDVCTATMVAPKLLVTARHCVTDANRDVACDADGTPLLGGEIRSRRDPANLFVFTGKDRPAHIGDLGTGNQLDTSQWHPAGQGAKVIDDSSGTLCNHDLALLLLKDAIPNVPLATLALDREAAVGEPLLTVGWGISSDQEEPSARRQRSGDVSVSRVGPDSAVPVLTKSEFMFGESICLGDSGGPIFSANTGALLGVVSRGGNGSNGPGASTCTQATNIGTKLAPFKELVTDAFNQAGASPLVEPPPKNGKCSCAPAPRASAPFWPLAAIGVAALRSVRRSRARTRPSATAR